MFRLVLVAGIFALLAACSTMYSPVSSAGLTDDSGAAGPPRSPGEGPAINPYYGAAGH